jgi:uncharacterized membrane protein YfcA
MSLTYWIIILAIIFISGIVKGTTGFGFALFSLPLLVHFVPIKILIPIITLFNLFSSAQIVIQLREAKLTRRILVLSVSGVIGVVIGSLILKYLSDRALKMMASCILILLSLMFLTGYRFRIRKVKRGIVIAGFISGLFGGSTSVSGPPLALFLTSLRLDTVHFRYTFAWFSIITASIAFFDYIKIGVVSLPTFKIFLVSLPILVLSVELGRYISQKISQRIFYQASIVITLLAGMLMFYTCCFGKQVAIG